MHDAAAGEVALGPTVGALIAGCQQSRVSKQWAAKPEAAGRKLTGSLVPHGV